MIITIDGPTASGKSTVARMIAQKLGWYYLGSGYLYRSITYLLMNKFHYTEDALKAPKLDDVCAVTDPHRFHYSYVGNDPVITYDGEDITPYLKNKEMDLLTSVVATNPMVREKLLELQRHIGSKYNVVVEGRDIGSVVFPKADIKFFITAALEERARRWQEYMAEHQYMHYSLNEAANAITERDDRDSHRAHSPLIATADSVIIDNSGLDKEQTLNKMLEIIREKLSLC